MTHEVSIKVETHNHPSALEPFGGANTGVGGVIRDVLGVSALPIANTDVLCFGPLDLPERTRCRRGVLHPRRVAAGVVAGVRDYGNKLGIPTVNGAVLYDPGYIANPLVFCGTVGLAPRGKHPHNLQPGDAVVVLGGRTGRDGIHGATFSSAELTHTTGRGCRQRGADRRPDHREEGARRAAPGARRRPLQRDHRLRRGRALLGGGRDGRGYRRAGGAGRCAAQVRRPAALGDLAFRGAGAHGPGRAAAPS